MGDIYISGNSRRNHDTQEIPAPPKRPVPPRQSQPRQVRRPQQGQPTQGQRPQYPAQGQPTQGQRPQYPAQGQPRQGQRPQYPAQGQQPQGQQPQGQQPQGQQPGGKRVKPKKKHRFLKTIFVLLLVALLLGGLAFGAVYGVAGKIDSDESGLSNNAYIDSAALMSDKKVLNILLLGVDGSTEENSLRSDSMILVSIDRNNKKIKMTSFLRDTWVYIPSEQGYNRLNAAFRYGGAQLAVDTIEYNYHVDIDHYMLVGFDMFEAIIDSIGGIEVEVTEREAEFMRDTARVTKNITSGENVHMNGAQALVYCRIRKLDSDFMRTSRQRKVIAALVNKAKSAGVTELVSIANDILPMVRTDMTAMELTTLAMGAVKYIGYDIVSERVPYEDTWSNKTINGSSVIVVDFDANREFLNEYLYSDDPEDTTQED